MKKCAILLCVCAFGFIGQADNHEPMTVEQINEVFGWNFEEIEITTEKVADGLHVLFGAGGNIAVFGRRTRRTDRRRHVSRNGTEDSQGNRSLRRQRHRFCCEHTLAFSTMRMEISYLVQKALTSSHTKIRVQMNRVDSVVNLVQWKISQNAYPVDAQPVIAFDESMRFHLQRWRHRSDPCGTRTPRLAMLWLFSESRMQCILETYSITTGYPFYRR